MTPRRRAVVTGAASGIGLATATRFLADGWEVHGWDLLRRDLSIGWSNVDVTEWEAVHDAVAELDRVDCAVIAAGVGSREPAVMTTENEWRRVLAINLDGAFYCAHALQPALATAGGTLVFLASVTANVGFRNRAVYSASKAAIVSLTRSLAIEWAEDGIRVVAISPTFTKTPLVEAGISRGDTDPTQIYSRTPQRRMLDADEVAAAIVQIAGTTFRSVTGTQILLDGGLSAYGGF
jgi:NAD(P)-dependent dehydrogenase (short-subunit alcohol dehydrogenase family)